MTRAARLARPLLAAVALTRRGRERMTPEGLHVWSAVWHADPSAWWIEPDAGIACLAPEVHLRDSDGEQAMLTIRGSVTARGREEQPSGWALTPRRCTAALLYDILERDTKAVDGMRGQFALVAWDGRRQRLLAARDHVGQRCLFTRVVDGVLLLCSELAPLLRLDGRCSLNHEAALWHLAFGMPTPGQTLASEVQRVPAAHALLWEPGQPARRVRYWTPLDPDAPSEADESAIGSLRSTLDRAVGRSLGNGSGLGLLLSGGVDSTYLAATVVGMGCSDVRALTAAFEPQHGMNESEYAAAVTEWLGIEHSVVTLTAPRAAELLEQVALDAAEPCTAWATLTHFSLLARARQLGIERMLSGLGADEIFGGYDHARGYYSRFLRHRARHARAATPEHLTLLLAQESQAATRVLYPGVARFFDDASLRAGLTDSYRHWHYASHLREFYRECLRLKPSANYMELVVAYELQHRVPDLLFAGFEPISRRLGVDVDYPFLDPDVTRIGTGFGPESRYRTPTGKFSLRRQALHPRFKHVMLMTAADRVPEPIRQRPRKSLTAPFGAWMFDPDFAPQVLARLRASGFWDEDMVRREWLEWILARIEPRPSQWAFQLWALITLAGWYDRFVHRG